MKEKVFNFVKSEKFSISIITLLIIPIFAWNLNGHVGLRIVADEMGPLASAAFLHGYDWSGIMSAVGYYSYGYALILYPLFLLFDNMVYILRAAVLINCIMLSFVFPISYSMAKQKVPDANRWILIAISLAVTFFFANVLNVRLIWTEAILIFLFWMLCYLISKVNKESHMATFVLIGFLLVYAYMVHTRVLSITIAGFLSLIILKFNNKITAKQLIVVFSVMATMLLLHYFYLKPQVQQHIWLNPPPTPAHYTLAENINVTATENVAPQRRSLANDYGFILNRLQRLSSLENIKSLIRVAVGQLFSLGSSTFLLAFVGLLFMSKNIIINFINSIKKRSNEDNNSTLNVLEIFILITFIISFGVSALFKMNPSRLDQLFYERYIYHVVGPIVFIALLHMFCYKSKVKNILILSVLLHWLLLPIVQTIFPLFPSRGVGFWQNAIGFFTFFNTETDTFYVLLAYFGMFLFLFLAIATKMSNKIKLFSLSLLSITFLLIGLNTVHNILLPQVNATSAHYSNVSAKLIRHYANQPIFATRDVTRLSLSHIQFFQPETPITVLPRDEFSISGDHLLLSSNPQAMLHEYEIVEYISPNIILLSPLESELIPRYDYTFSNNETFFFTGFAHYESSCGFRWMIGGRSSIHMSLDKQNYYNVLLNQTVHNHSLSPVFDDRELTYQFILNEHKCYSSNEVR